MSPEPRNQSVCGFVSRWQIPLILVAILLVCCMASASAAPAEKGDAPEKKDKASALLRDYRGDIVLIKGKAGSGSGFIADIKGRKFMVSNAHVLAAIKAPTFTLLDRTPLKFKPGAASVAL